MTDIFVLAVWGIIFLILIVKFFQSIRLVSTKTSHIVERFSHTYPICRQGDFRAGSEGRGN